MNHELAKTLTLALVNYIDENRPEGTMDCSSGECVSLEKAFTEENFDSVETLINKKLSRLTEFEKCMLDFAKARDEYEFDSTKVVELNNKVIELTKSYAKKLLAIAKEELLTDGELAKKYFEGYTKGYENAEKRYNESVAFHFPIMPTPPSGWGCDGTHCTNPQMDCINCPRKTTGGGFNTSSGTSTATMHGNTSATDGKEHNLSFTD